jgi:cytochrome c-type biogenesis protein
MDLGPWVQTFLADNSLPWVGAFLIGFLASLGPCPLTTNIAALGYITRESSPRRVLLTCGGYTLGRACGYGVLGIGVLAAGLQMGRVSNSLQTFAEIALGPVLILVGLALLDVIHPTLNLGGEWLMRSAHRIATWKSIGAFLLGALFALAFCPYSAALYFGVLIPLAFQSAGGIALPFIFGIGTSVVVLLIGAPLALGVHRVARALNVLARVEVGMRKIAALAFIGAGVALVWNWVAAH